MTAAPDRSPHDTPYADLTPDFVLDALDSVGLRGDGRLLQLNSYENRVFQVFLEDGAVVVAKFYRPERWSDEQILEEHRFSAQLAAEEIPVAAPLVLAADAASPLAPVLLGEPPTLARLGHRGPVYRYAVAARCSGRAPALEDLSQLEWIGRFIGRMHAVGAREPFRFRATLSVAAMGWAARDWLREHAIVPAQAEPGWSAAAEEALDLAQAAFDRARDLRTLRLHGDFHIGNLLWTDAGPHFVDLDDAVMGPAVQDLWMMIAGDQNTRRRYLDALLRGYENFFEFDDRELTLIEPLRTLRIVHHSAWLAKRWRDPAFPAAFPWFAQPAYWQQQAQELREQSEAMRAALAYPLV